MAFKTNNTARFNAIMNSRLEVGMQHVGEVLPLRVTSVTLGYWDGKNELLKDIYNLNASKAPYLDSPEFKADYDKALALEAAGDTDGAHELFDSLLNKSTLTVSVINNGGMATQFSKDEIINCPIETAIVNEGKADERKTVVINKPYAKRVVQTATKSKRFTTEIEVASATQEAIASALETAEAAA